MLNQSGAYSYNGRLVVPVSTIPPGTNLDGEKAIRKRELEEELCEGAFAKLKDLDADICHKRNSALRYKTLWGKPYAQMHDEFYKK